MLISHVVYAYMGLLYILYYLKHNVFHCLIFVFVLEAPLCTALSDSVILDYQGF